MCQVTVVSPLLMRRERGALPTGFAEWRSRDLNLKFIEPPVHGAQYTDGLEECAPFIGWPCWPVDVWPVVTVEVVNPSPHTLTVKVTDNSRSESFSLSGHHIVTATIAIDLFADALLDYRVKVTATDVAGNTASATEHLDRH